MFARQSILSTFGGCGDPAPGELRTCHAFGLGRQAGRLLFGICIFQAVDCVAARPQRSDYTFARAGT